MLVPPVLFANPEVIDRARDAAIAAKDGNKKLSLPEMIPGFKANSLDIRKWLHFPHPPFFFGVDLHSLEATQSIVHQAVAPPPFIICLLKAVFVSSILLELRDR